MTTQPHPEPSEEASSLPVVAHLVEKGRIFVDQPVLEEDEAERAAFKRQDGAIVSPLVRLSDAQSQLNAMRAELERKSDAIQKLWKERDEARSERDIEAAARSTLKAELRHANAMREENADSIAGLRTQVENWQGVVWAVARELNCLPSTFSDGNGHVLKAAIKLNAERAAATMAQTKETP